MDGAVREVEEERLGRVRGLDLADHPHGAIGEVVGEVVPVGVLVGLDDRVALVQPVRVVEVRECLEESVVLVEPALQRPGVLVTGFGQVGVLAQVPFADSERGEAVVAEQLGDRGLVLWELAGVPGEPGVDVGDLAHPDGVSVSSRQERCPRRRAQRRDMEVGVPQATASQRIEMWRGDLAAVAAEIGEAEVVGQHDHNVRRAIGCATALPPGGLGGREHPPHLAVEPWIPPPLGACRFSHVVTPLTVCRRGP